MPVEIRTADGRHWARPAIQNHARLPLVRLVTEAERRRRRLRAVACIILAGAALIAALTYAERLLIHG